jgi:hypothetical protein
MTVVQDRMAAPTTAAGSLTRGAAAFGLDYMVIAGHQLLLVAVGLDARQVAPEIGKRVFAEPLLAQLVGFVALILPVTLSFASSEAETCPTCRPDG